jgi:hypothetical protein
MFLLILLICKAIFMLEVVVLASMTSHCRDTLRREYVKYPVQQVQVGTCPFVAPYSARKVPQCIRL